MTHDTDLGQFAVIALLSVIVIGAVLKFGTKILDWLLDLFF